MESMKESMKMNNGRAMLTAAAAQPLLFLFLSLFSLEWEERRKGEERRAWRHQRNAANKINEINLICCACGGSKVGMSLVCWFSFVWIMGRAPPNAPQTKREQPNKPNEMSFNLLLLMEGIEWNVMEFNGIQLKD